MKKNLGSKDKVIRVILAVILGVFILTNQITGTLAIVFGVVSVLLLLTSLIGFCPVYFPFNFSTLKKSDKS